MGFLPDIDEKGVLIDKNPIPKLYTPKETHFPLKLESLEIRKDTLGTHFKDAPTMNNIHECVPNQELVCIVCHREMII